MPGRRNALYILTIVSLLVGLFTGRAELFSIAYLVGALLAASLLWTWLSLRGIAIRRSTRARRSQVGRVFKETFSLRKTGILPKLWLEIYDHSTLPGHNASHIVPTVLGGREYSWEAQTICSARGEFQLGPMTVLSGDPFGLFNAPRHIGLTERLVVYPLTIELEQVNLPVGFLSGGEAQRQLTHQVTTIASSIRDYVPGDSMNRIHWRSTARSGNLMVKEFELDPLVDIWLLCDFSAESLVEDTNVKRSGTAGTIIASSSLIPPSTEEYAAILAASLAKHFLEDERMVGFIAYTPQRQLFQPERGGRQLARILEALAIARSTSKHSLAELLSLETHQFTRGRTLLVITASRDQAWISGLQILQRRGVRPVCVYIDANTFNPRLDTSAVRGMVQLAGIPTLTVGKDDDIALALKQRPQ